MTDSVKNNSNFNYPNYDLFKNPDLWQNYDSGNQIISKLKYLKSIIPEDVNSIVDVGCGNGIITNHFAENIPTIGADLSFAALQHVIGTKIQASADRLAFKDRSFDLVFSSELLEHLPEKILGDTISELQRIVRKYIIVTVPNNEFLDVNFIKCPECNHIFHSYGHLHSFSAKHIKNLIGDDFEVIYTDVAGPRIKSYHKLLLKIKRISGKNWFPANEYTCCPNCGNNRFYKNEKSILSKLCNGFNLVLSLKKHYWLIMIFKRHSTT